MAELIRFLLSNFTLTFFVLGLLAARFALLRKPSPWTRGEIVEELLAWFLFFSIGVGLFYNFVMHVFFGDLAASFIGWANSPFQAEVGYASLGFAAVGFLAFRGDPPVRLAAILGPALFFWGAAVGHVLDMVRSQQLRARQRRCHLLDRHPAPGRRAGARRRLSPAPAGGSGRGGLSLTRPLC